MLLPVPPMASNSSTGCASAGAAQSLSVASCAARPMNAWDPMYRGSAYSAGGAGYIFICGSARFRGPASGRLAVSGLRVQESAQLGDKLRRGDLEFAQAVEYFVDPVDTRVRG